jgi:trehalose 6-phosphate phosphatase
VHDVPELLLPLTRQPERAALFLDFDGTLSAIVAEPLAARPLPGVPELLARLARTVGLVAVISGRPNSFLGHVLDTPPGVLMVGLYGLELALAAKGQEAQAANWSEQIAAAAAEAAAEAPEGAFVEPKGLTVTLHWRQAPETESWIVAFAQRQHQSRGLSVHPARRSIELRPPLEVDKGTVIRTLVAQMDPAPTTVAVFGDDLGDLPAFDVLPGLRAEGLAAIGVAAVDQESPPEIAARADLTVEGPPGVVALLEQLAQAIDQRVAGV